MPSFALIRADQYTATTDLQCITVIIPDGDEYKALLAGMLQLPANVLNYADPDSAQAEGVSSAWADAIWQIDWEGCVLPQNEGLMSHLDLWIQDGIIISGNPLTFTTGATLMHGYVGQQTAAAQFDRIDFKTWLVAGNWLGHLVYSKSSANGICTVFARPTTGSAINCGSVDMYAAAGSNNNIGTFGMTITDSGFYTISIQADSKHASSTGYRLSYPVLSLWRAS